MSFSILPAVGSGGIVGFMFGLLGGGGSILATPLLLYVVGVAQPHIAIGTGRASAAFSGPCQGSFKNIAFEHGHGRLLFQLPVV